MKHVLIVGDDAVYRNLAAQLVEQHHGLSVRFAHNGLEAVEILEETTPLAVITELRMPEMNGLELVRAMRARFATIPVVLMTSHGSEEIAVEALVEGAADFVPKHRLANDLPRVLRNVLHGVSGSHRHQEITHLLRYEQLQFSLHCDESLVAPVVDQLQQVAIKLGVVEKGDRVRLARCLAEAIHNALTHGGQRPEGSPADASLALRVDITAEVSQSEARFVIRDQGPGFDHKAIADPRIDPRHLTADSGRGLALIRLFMDEVKFNATGNELTAIKRKPVSARRPQTPAPLELAGAPPVG